MIPSVLAHQLKKGVEDFLQTTFPVSTPFFHGIMDRLLNGNSQTGIFKGPYLSIHLPFKTGNGKDEFFPEIPMDFTVKTPRDIPGSAGVSPAIHQFS